MFPFHAISSGKPKQKGKALYEQYIENNRLKRIGPNFATVWAPNSERGTSPDIFLTNRHTYHNFHHEPMDANCSDHIPAKAIISCKPITRTIRKPNINKADWEGYKKNIKDHTTVSNVRNQSTQAIDQGLQTIIENIKTAKEEFIPKNTMVPRPFIPSSPKFDRLTKVLNELHKARIKKPSRQIIAHITSQRKYTINLLREEGKLLARQHWKDIIEKTASTRKSDPKKFWRNIKRFMGHRKEPITITTNGEPYGIRLKKEEGVEEHMKKYG